MKQIIEGILCILNASEKKALFKLIIFDLLIAILDVAFLGSLLVLVNFYTRNTTLPGDVHLPAVFSSNHSLLLIGIFSLLFGGKNCIAFLGQRWQHHFFYRIASRLSKQNIQAYLKGDYNHFAHTDSSVHIRKISQQPIEFSHYILTNFQQIVSQSILILFTAAAILIYHPSLFLLLFLLLLPPVIMLAWFIRSRLKTLRTQTKTASERTIQYLNESLAGYVESNIYSANNFFTRRYVGHQQQLNENLAAQQSWQGLPSRLIEVFAILGFLLLIAINKWTTGLPAISLLTTGVFMAAAYKIIPGIVKIVNSSGQMKTYEFVLTDLGGARADLHVHDLSKPRRIKSVEFEQVGFDYTDHPVLSGCNFKITKGDFVGLSADSGRGKTTLINLLLGFLEQGSGTIRINGDVVDMAARKQYRKNISLIKQQPFFIHDSVLKNITLTEELPDEQQLAWVLAFCGLDAQLDKYEEGVLKTISEHGRNISGGQRQRIMLARALYHDADLLILDEPLGEMDMEAERTILVRLQQLALQGKMIMLVTHNKDSLAFCNRIISLHGE